MADLDDFFAKKDRKKSKGKKFTTTDEIAKKLEETGKRTERPKPKEKIMNPEGEESQQMEEEDEWREFEEEKKDYTGLKIGNLTVNEAALDPDFDYDRGTGDNSSDGESGEAGSKHNAPWKKTEESVQPVQPVQSVQPQPQPQSGRGTYKTPHLRNRKPSASPQLRSKNIAPDINSEEYFPTLNSKQATGSDTAGAWGRWKKDEGTFEEVRNRGSGRSYNVQDTQAQVPKLSLGNKYGALSQDQS